MLGSPIMWMQKVHVADGVSEDIQALPKPSQDHDPKTDLSDSLHATPSQTSIIGRNIYAKVSRSTQRFFKAIGAGISLCSIDPLIHTSSRYLTITYITIFTSLTCFLFAYILFVLRASRHIWVTPLFYDAVHTCIIVLESYGKTKRFCHRNVCKLFSYNVREMHNQTMLWVRPLVSLYFAIILSCLLWTLTNIRAFEGILIRMVSYHVFWFGSVWQLFHIAAHSDPYLLNVVLPDQRTTAEIHNLNNAILTRTRGDQLSDVLQVREDHIWHDSIDTTKPW